MNNYSINDFEQIYNEQYNNTLKYIIIKTNSLTVVNDILQDTYLELYKKLKKGTICVTDINSYILGFSNNIIKRYNRKYHLKKEVSFEENLENVISKDFDYDEILSIEYDVKKIFELLNQKDDLTKKIFELRYSFDMKIPDIAKVLDMPESNVKNRLYRTIKELRNLHMKGCD